MTDHVWLCEGVGGWGADGGVRKRPCGQPEWVGALAGTDGEWGFLGPDAPIKHACLRRSKTQAAAKATGGTPVSSGKKGRGKWAPTHRNRPYSHLVRSLGNSERGRQLGARIHAPVRESSDLARSGHNLSSAI